MVDDGWWIVNGKWWMVDGGWWMADVEQDDNEITTLLQDYIKRKSNREVDKSSAISTIGESSSSAISAIDERPVINESSPVAGITSIGEIFNSSHEIQRNEGNINAELNLQTVKNPNKVTIKDDRPSEGI
ncbi:unnamed protein product [Rhizophagus irregularis]|nr:unnamed protein product [Rhizophagus irregularis]